MTLRVHPAAQAEADAAVAWYESQRLGLGDDFLAALERAYERISENPLQFPRLETLESSREVRRVVLIASSAFVDHANLSSTGS